MLVRPGKYCSLETFYTSEDTPKVIIDIIGIDTKNQDYWLDSDNKRYTDDELINNWVLIDMSRTDAVPSKYNINLGELEESSEKAKVVVPDNQPVVSNPPQTTVVKQPDIKPQPTSLRTEDDVINRCKVDDQSLYRDVNVEISMQLTVDTNRIAQSIPLLDLDINYIIERLTDDLMNKLTLDTNHLRLLIRKQITDFIQNPVSSYNTVVKNSIMPVEAGDDNLKQSNIPDSVAEHIDIESEIIRLSDKLNHIKP